METKYQPVIGLEIHVELKTKSKMFCQCAADYFEKQPNSNTCTVCLGLPGALPVPNKKAIEWTILIGQALNCKINKISKFDRKHYFYPDLPKGYQISQYDEPIAVGGFLTVNGKKFKITRVHLEEDTGKLIHKDDETLIDFNRSGVPLVEIVTEPDFENSQDVKAFLEELHTIIKEYLQVSNANMERGDMRLEPNISLRKETRNKKQGTSKFQLPNYKVEVKNINSFRFAQKAVDYEIKRQTEILDKGETPTQETRGWDENHNKTVSQRTKEEAHDYRYFPEPDIPPLEFTSDCIEQIKKQLPELPQQKLERYVRELGIKEQDAFVLTRERASAKLFERAVSEIKLRTRPQTIANVIINKKAKSIAEIEEKLASKAVDPEEILGIANRVIKSNPSAYKAYKEGKRDALIGPIMRETKGKADFPSIISALEKLK